ncbi:MAG: Hpt domain-containing protein [Kistimonas sp.]|nr:Hpt domain-containing protein [Kistimonas sp.]
MEAINSAVLDALVDMLGDEGQETVLELIGLYKEDSPAQMRTMRTALADLDAEAFRRAAHSLKSSSASVGAEGLQALCQQLEENGQQGDLGPETDALLTQAETVLAEVESALNTFVAQG